MSRICARTACACACLELIDGIGRSPMRSPTTSAAPMRQQQMPQPRGGVCRVLEPVITLWSDGRQTRRRRRHPSRDGNPSSQSGRRATGWTVGKCLQISISRIRSRALVVRSRPCAWTSRESSRRCVAALVVALLPTRCSPSAPARVPERRRLAQAERSACSSSTRAEVALARARTEAARGSRGASARSRLARAARSTGSGRTRRVVARRDPASASGHAPAPPVRSDGQRGPDRDPPRRRGRSTPCSRGSTASSAHAAEPAAPAEARASRPSARRRARAALAARAGRALTRRGGARADAAATHAARSQRRRRRSRRSVASRASPASTAGTLEARAPGRQSARPRGSRRAADARRRHDAWPSAAGGGSGRSRRTRTLVVDAVAYHLPGTRRAGSRSGSA